ncbi:MAG TPA: ABC transporter permease, partial [Pseudoneobacillus sp.]|nr:ABC transporter permease [Pseudoneobacillus sp.]
MFNYTVRRLFSLIPVLFGMTLVVFAIIHAIPGNPAQVILGQRATAESIAALTSQLGLDRPWYIQYFDYLGSLFQGDLGSSLRTHAQINQEIWPYLAATFELTLAAMIIAVVVGVNAGIISAWFSKSWFDYVAMVFALVGVSMPIFWLGLMMQWGFSIELGWLPTTGRNDVRDPIQSFTNLYLIDTLLQG